jgi:hypothetical protein
MRENWNAEAHPQQHRNAVRLDRRQPSRPLHERRHDAAEAGDGQSGSGDGRQAVRGIQVSRDGQFF